jgi:hypothetical protein
VLVMRGHVPARQMREVRLPSGVNA